MSRLNESSHLDLCCVQKLLLSPVTVKELREAIGVILVCEMPNYSVWESMAWGGGVKNLRGSSPGVNYSRQRIGKILTGRIVLDHFSNK